MVLDKFSLRSRTGLRAGIAQLVDKFLLASFDLEYSSLSRSKSSKKSSRLSGKVENKGNKARERKSARNALPL